MDWESLLNEVITILLKPGQTYSITGEANEYIEITISDGRTIKAFCDRSESPLRWVHQYNFALTGEEVQKIFEYESEVFGLSRAGGK